MKRILSMLAVMGMVVSMMVPTVTAGSVFDDVADTSEFAQYIHGLYNEGVISGLGGNYYPFNNVTRAEMAKMSVNGAGLEMKEAEGAPHFDDVPRTHSLYSFVETAYAYGIVSGRSETMFAPDEPVLRQEAMKIAMGSFRTNDTDGYFAEDLSGAPHFSDVPASNEFYGDIETAYNLGIVNGYGDGRFGPMDQMRRDQMAKVVHNSMRVARGEDVKGEEGYVLKVGVSADEVRNDGSSLVQVTATIEKDGAVDDNYSEPVKFETTLGEWENDESDFTDTASEGRAHATLTASDEEGTATITVTAPGVPTGTAQVVFSSDAPRTEKGFGSSRTSGVGSIQVFAGEEDILIDDTSAVGFLTDFTPIDDSYTPIVVSVQDTDDIPVNSDSVICTIVEGDGAMVAGTGVVGPAGATVQSATLVPDLDNGLYFGGFVTLDDATPDDITIQCIDLDTSPSLTVDMDIETFNVTLDAWANHDELLTRNQTQVGAGTNIIQNAATLFVRVNDEDGDPVQSTQRTIRATITEGADANALLMNSVGSDNNQINAEAVIDGDGNQIPGYYMVQYIAGTSEGDVTIEFRDTTAIGTQPTTEVTLNVYNPEFEVYKSADRVGIAGSNADSTTLVVKVVDNDDVPIFDETVCVKIVSDAGTGSILTTNTGAGNCGGGSVQMDQLLDVVAAPTGFYTAEYTGPAAIFKNDATDLEFFNNVDRTGVDMETDSVDVYKSSTPNFIIDDLELLPIETVIGPNQITPVVIFAKDDEGYGVECAANGGGACPNPTDPTDVTVQAIQNGAVDPILEVDGQDGGNLGNDGAGNGAYLTAFIADQVGGTKGEMQATAPTVTPVQARQRFDIVDNDIELELLDDEVMTDEGLGALIYAYDHNDDPVYGLDYTGTGAIVPPNPPSGGNVVINPDAANNGPLELTPNFGVALVGSGVYVFTLDTTTDVNEGTYEVNVSAVIGRTVTDDDSFEVTRPTIDINCMPDFVVTNNTVSCAVRVLDENDDPLVIPDHYLRVTTSRGGVEEDVLADTADAKIDSLTDVFAATDGMYYFTVEGGAIEDTAEVTVELYDQDISGSLQSPVGELITNEMIDVDIR